MKPIETELVVVGAGPGGYAAAFHAADRGMKVILVEQEHRLGGVCLNRGCIPSKALLHATGMIRKARESTARGIEFDAPRIHLEKLKLWKESILQKLGEGISGLAQKRGVQVLNGRGHLEDSQTLRVETSDGQQFIRYKKAVLAVGSKSALPKEFDLGNPRIMTSREALAIEEIPGNLLIIGAGYIGMELGTVYATLGSKIVIVEAQDSILTGMDADLVRPVQCFAEQAFHEVLLRTKVLKMTTHGDRIKAVMESEGKEKNELFDGVLVAVGRVPNCDDLGLENTKLKRDEKGFIQVDSRQQTADPAILAIGDVTGGAKLAHKATREARVAIETLTGESGSMKNVIIPAVIFTDPEIAWCGLMEGEARKQGTNIRVSQFSWTASGRAQTLDRTDGLTKLIVDPESERILGAGITGHGAGELIAECVLAMEMGATAEDLAASVHPHPTLSETVMESAELFYGRSIHALTREKVKKTI